MTRARTAPARARFSRVALAFTLAMGALAPDVTQAQDAYACVDELDDADVTRRTRTIARQFREHERHAKVFRFGWASFFAALAVAEFGILGPRTSGAQRWNAYISGVGASSAMLQMLALPMPGVWARRRIERMPADTPQQRREQLRYALDALESAANAQRIIEGPLSHATALVWSIGWGTLISVKFDKPLVAAMSFLGGPLINETRILTAPGWAQGAWAQTRGGFCWGRYVDDTPREAYWDEPETEARLLPGFGGLSLRVTF